MKNNSIELITEFSDNGEPLRTETFLTRSTIKLVMVYECVSFLALLKETPNTHQVQEMIDLVTRIYDNQFTKNQLIDGLPSHSAVFELYEQITFVASGKHIDEEIADDAKSTTVNSWEDYKNNLKATIQDMTKEGNQSVNTVLDMPFYFVFDELNGEAKKKEQSSSMLSAFGAV